MELREQALIGGAALAALAQALTSLVGGSRFPQRWGWTNENQPPKMEIKKQLLVKGSIKMWR